MRVLWFIFFFFFNVWVCRWVSPWCQVGARVQCRHAASRLLHSQGDSRRVAWGAESAGWGGLQQASPGAQPGACSAGLLVAAFCLQQPDGMALPSCKMFINTEGHWLFFTSSLSQDVQPLWTSWCYPRIFCLSLFASVSARNLPVSCNIFC